ncbi:MAG: hypothetical protein HYT80_06790 [Euryarchaeota archaeon]|nr:hypothetical protein [Euryarchaeota archaeon]
MALFVGAIVFCPCHLPVTIAGLTAIGALAWLTEFKALLYLAFGVTYLFVVVVGVRYLSRKRDEERRRETIHEEHHIDARPAPANPAAVAATA